MALPGGGRGVARLAVPLDEVAAAVGAVRHILWGALVVALVVALVASTTVAQVLSRALRRMTDAARRMAAGDLAVRLRPPGTDEIAELGRALDTMATSLAATLAALRGERDLLGLILESMREGVLVLDQQGRMLLVNPALRATLGIPADAEGRAALELIRNAELPSILERARAAGGPVSGEIETTGPRPRRLLVHAAPLPMVNGKHQGLLAVFVDVSETRRLETLRKDFVANVSHELRTPITAVRSAVDTLRLTLAGDPAASERFVDIIDRNAQRLGALVEDLLDLSRIESKDYRPEAKPVPLRAVADQALTLLRARIEEKSLDVGNEIPADLPPARADRRALEQVFTNLLDNAVKYCARRARASACARSGRTAGCASRSPTPAPASSRATCPGCSSASTASTAAARATWAAPGWASRSSSTWSRRWAARSASRARPAAAARSGSRSRRRCRRHQFSEDRGGHDAGEFPRDLPGHACCLASSECDSWRSLSSSVCGRMRIGAQPPRRRRRGAPPVRAVAAAAGGGTGGGVARRAAATCRDRRHRGTARRATAGDLPGDDGAAAAGRDAGRVPAVDCGDLRLRQDLSLWRYGRARRLRRHGDADATRVLFVRAQPAHHRRRRASPARPPCPPAARRVDAADIMRDIADADVQKALAKATPPTFGGDRARVDGTIFQFLRADGRGFLAGTPAGGAQGAGCVDVPIGITRLVNLLRALDQQQLRDPSCAAPCAERLCRSR